MKEESSANRNRRVGAEDRKEKLRQSNVVLRSSCVPPLPSYQHSKVFS